MSPATTNLSPQSTIPFLTTTIGSCDTKPLVMLYKQWCHYHIRSRSRPESNLVLQTRQFGPHFGYLPNHCMERLEPKPIRFVSSRTFQENCRGSGPPACNLLIILFNFTFVSLAPSHIAMHSETFVSGTRVFHSIFPHSCFPLTMWSMSATPLPQAQILQYKYEGCNQVF
jgi:hypothetical protein